MKRNLHKIMLAATIALFSCSAMSAYMSDEHAKRLDIISKNKNNQENIVIGLMPGFGKFEDASKLTAKYMPLMNYLSGRMGANVSFVPERDTVVIKKMFRAQKYKWFYSNAEMSVVAEEMGYKPVAVDNSRIDSVIFVPEDSKINSWADLYKKRVGSIPNTMVNSIAQAKFYKEGVSGIMESVDMKVLGQDLMFKFLDDGKVDAIVIRGQTAENTIKKNPGKYRIALKAGSVPGYVFMAAPTVPDVEIQKMKKTLTEMNFDTPEQADVLRNFGKKAGKKAIFTAITTKDLADMRNVLLVTEPDFVKVQ